MNRLLQTILRAMVLICGFSIAARRLARALDRLNFRVAGSVAAALADKLDRQAHAALAVPANPR